MPVMNFFGIVNLYAMLAENCYRCILNCYGQDSCPHWDFIYDCRFQRKLASVKKFAIFEAKKYF